ncbi:hypothetical protein MTO96_022399 [Rhipicephalus appendiculatus]
MVHASECEHEGRLIVKKLVAGHNDSLRLARQRNRGTGPIHFAEVCAGDCNKEKVGKRCWPNCICGVLNLVNPHIYMCFEEGKPLPMGFTFTDS